VPLQVPVMHGDPWVQHGSPDPPHRVHVPVVEQIVPVSVQVLPGQHGNASLPHDSQKPPDVHTSLIGGVPHAASCATHLLGLEYVSQQPALQRSPTQHG
jgi:hypothetical protein